MSMSFSSSSPFLAGPLKVGQHNTWDQGWVIIKIFDQGWAQIILPRLELIIKKESFTLLTKIIDEIISEKLRNPII